MLFGDLPRVTQKPEGTELIICSDGVHLKRVDYRLLYPDVNVAVTPIVTEGTEIARIGINGNSVSLYAPGTPANVLIGARVNGRDVVRDGVADITIPVTDVIQNGQSTVVGRIAKINSVVDVVDENDVSLMDEHHVAHINNSGGGSGDVADVVDLDGNSLLDADKIAHIPVTSPMVIQPTLDYDSLTAVEESRNWAITTQYTWTAPADCVIFMKNCSNYMYKLGSLTSWLHGVGLENGSFGRCLLPMSKGTQITIQMRAATTSGSPVHLYYILFDKVNGLTEPLVQPYPDYNDIRTVEYTASVSADQIACEYVAPRDGLLVVDTTFSKARYDEPTFSINETFEQYAINTNTNFDIGDGIPLKKGDTFKLWYPNSGTITGDIKFVPFAACSNYKLLKSPIPDWNGEITEYTRAQLPATLESGYWINEQANNNAAGNYPINYTVSGVSGTFTVDDYYSDGGTFDNIKAGKLYSAGTEIVGSLTTANHYKAYVVPLVDAYEEESGYRKTVLYSGGTAPATGTVQGVLTLSDDILNYDEIEIVSAVGYGTGKYVFSQKFNSEYFVDNFPYVSDPGTGNTIPHAIIFTYTSNFSRAIMGDSNNKINLFNKSGSNYVSEIYGIKY